MSAFGGKADISLMVCMSAFDPKQTFPDDVAAPQHRPEIFGMRHVWTACELQALQMAIRDCLGAAAITRWPDEKSAHFYCLRGSFSPRNNRCFCGRYGRQNAR
jgi:hypothetical protein